MAAVPMGRIQHIHDDGRGSSALPIAASMLAALPTAAVKLEASAVVSVPMVLAADTAKGSVLVHSRRVRWSQVQDSTYESSCEMHQLILSKCVKPTLTELTDEATGASRSVLRCRWHQLPHCILHNSHKAVVAVLGAYRPLPVTGQCLQSPRYVQCLTGSPDSSSRDQSFWNIHRLTPGSCPDIASFFPLR